VVKVLIFDFGGVLGPDSDDWNGSFKKVLTQTGLTFEEIQRAFNFHWPRLKFGQEDTLNFWNDVVRISKNKITPDLLEKVYFSGMTINRRILNLAKKYKNKGLKLVILSNEAKNWMDEKVERFQLKGIFSKIYCSADLGISKPNREIIEYLLKDLKIKPNEAVFVDNQQSDVEAAQSLGIKSILFENSKQLKKDLTVQFS
jgi:putative hydrolase of the HAD superfamily